MFFQNITGLEPIKEILSTAIAEQKIAHAQLFSGQSGSANLALALGYAGLLLCQNKVNNQACGTCSSCLKHSKLIHPDVHFLFPVNTNKEVKKDASSDDFIASFREAVIANPYLSLSQWVSHIQVDNKQVSINKKDISKLLEKLSLTSYESGYKIVIVWQAEKIHHAAAPKLLKTLEEPTDKTIFLLVSNQPSKLLATILSRTQQVKVDLFSKQEIKTHLANMQQFSEAQIQDASMVCGGSLGKALSYLNQEHESFEDEFLGWMRLCFSVHKNDNIAKIYNWVELFAKKSKDEQKNFLAFALDVFRQCAYLNYQSGHLVSLDRAAGQKFQKFAPFINERNIEAFSNAFDESIRYIERNANAKILMFDLSIQIAKMIRL